MSCVGRFPFVARRRRQMLQMMGLFMSNPMKQAAAAHSTPASRKKPAWVERCGPVTVVHVGRDDGSLRADALGELREILPRCAAEAEPPNLLIELSETDYFGGEFIGLLCDCQQEINHRHGQFSLCGVRPQLLGELRAVRLDAAWPIYSTCDEAIADTHEEELSTVP